MFLRIKRLNDFITKENASKDDSFLTQSLKETKSLPDITLF
jgi:hypothetical protein